MLNNDVYKSIFDSTPDAIIVATEAGDIVMANNRVEKILGYKKDELIGKKVKTLIPDSFAGKHHEHRHRYHKKPAAREMGAGLNLKAKRKDGTEFHAEISLSPIRLENETLVSASIRDVTQKKATEQELLAAKSKERFHDALDMMMEGVQIIDHGFRYLYLNDTVVKQSTYTREELLGYTMPEKYPGIEKSELFTLLKACIADGEVKYMENEFPFPDNTTRVFELHIQPVPEGLLILSIDITERKNSERALKIRNEQLMAKNRELEQFAYIASHDLQEPLRTASSFIDLFMKEFGSQLDERGTMFLSQVIGSTDRMRNLIRGLLEYSRIGRNKEREVVDCSTIVNEVLADLELLVKENNVDLSVEKLPVIKGYPNELKQLYQNLIVNAIKFRNKKGKSQVKVSAKESPYYWEFSVQDNGIGIEEQFYDKIFTIFQRLHTKKEYEGSGIGLAHCKKIAELHFGKIWVTSVPGQGSTFSFTIAKSEPDE